MVGTPLDARAESAGTASPALFIGVVSHAHSRFARSQGPDGLAARLTEALAALGRGVVVRVNTADLWDPANLPLGPAQVRASLDAQARLDRSWAQYISDEGDDDRPRHRRALRWLRRQQRRVRPPGVGMVRRLVNIELSHVDLLRHGLDSAAPWILILEDDAESSDIDDCAAGLAGLLAISGSAPAFVNVSHSFSLDELGIEHLLSPAPEQWSGTIDRRVLQAVRPATNTVCAVLYRRPFAEALLHELQSRPMEPVVPIDWRLNDVLMDMHRGGRFAEGDCWFVDPGPISQMSMRT